MGGCVRGYVSGGCVRGYISRGYVRGTCKGAVWAYISGGGYVLLSC